MSLHLVPACNRRASDSDETRRLLNAIRNQMLREVTEIDMLLNDPETRHARMWQNEGVS